MHQSVQEFAKKRCNILLVCKGSKEGGRKWQSLIDVHFPLFADERGDFVETLNLHRRSYWNICQTMVRNDFASVILAGQTLPPLPDPFHDLFQLGADLLVDSNGRVIFAYLCNGSTDWSTSDDILAQMTNVIDSTDKENGDQISGCTLRQCNVS